MVQTIYDQHLMNPIVLHLGLSLVELEVIGMVCSGVSMHALLQKTKSLYQLMEKEIFLATFSDERVKNTTCSRMTEISLSCWGMIIEVLKMHIKHEAV